MTQDNQDTKSQTMRVDVELPTEYRDSGQWRFYRLTSFGRTLQQLVREATIEEVDQDGGTITCYGLGDAPSDVERDAVLVLVTLLLAERDKAQ